jgi:hypothetical protein
VGNSNQLLAVLDSLLSGARMRAYMNEDIPSDLDAKLGELITNISRKPPTERAAIGGALTRTVAWGLRLFAVRMAGRAVRTGDPGYLSLGLRALALQVNPEDSRDVVVAVAPLSRAAELIGVLEEPLFDQAADFAESEASEFIRAFPRRPQEGRRLRDSAFTKKALDPRSGLLRMPRQWRIPWSERRSESGCLRTSKEAQPAAEP